jgi:predicted transcriptional regulator
MAHRLGCSRVSLSHYERGKMVPGGDKVEKLMEMAKSV